MIWGHTQVTIHPHPLPAYRNAVTEDCQICDRMWSVTLNGSERIMILISFLEDVQIGKQIASGMTWRRSRGYQVTMLDINPSL